MVLSKISNKFHKFQQITKQGKEQVWKIKSKYFYNRKIQNFAENWRRKKYEEKCRRGICCKEEYDFHMDCKQKKNLWSIWIRSGELESEKVEEKW